MEAGGEEVMEFPRRRWFTIKEACEYLDVSEQTLHRWMREGAITYYKIGGSTRFKPEDLDAFVKKFTSFGEAKGIVDKCARCGHAQLVEGSVQSTGRLYFRPKKTRFFTLREGVVKVNALVCPRCGHIMLIADVKKLARLLKDGASEGKS